jgi:hypothetical protein
MTAFIKALLAKFGILLHGLNAKGVIEKFDDAIKLVGEAHDLAQETKSNATTAITVLAAEVAKAEDIINKAKAITGK